MNTLPKNTVDLKTVQVLTSLDYLSYIDDKRNKSARYCYVDLHVILLIMLCDIERLSLNPFPSFFFPVLASV